MNKKQNQHQKKVLHPLVSVIMPVYNAQAYIAEAIESILNQTYTNIEFIIVDDKSNDGTEHILQAYADKDPRIQLIRPATKGYLSGSLNIALKKAKGKYIARMDADDISLPQRLEKQVAYLEQHKQIVALGCQEEIINDQGTVTADKFFPENSHLAYEMIMNFMVIQPPTLMARASVMKKLRYDTGIAKHDDIDMHFQLLQHGSFSNIPDIAFQYRVNEDSYTHSDIKHVYIMALHVRLRAIMKYGYRPNVFRLLLTLIQTLIVTVLPPPILMKLFELLRYKKNISFVNLSKRAFSYLLATH